MPSKYRILGIPDNIGTDTEFRVRIIKAELDESNDLFVTAQYIPDAAELSEVPPVEKLAAHAASIDTSLEKLAKTMSYIADHMHDKGPS